MAHLANLPMKLLMPTSSSDLKEIAFKTVPSATKVEIKHALESLYGLEVQKVRTLNMKGKKKHRGGSLIAKPDYKKAYVTLKNPLSVSPGLYPISSSTIEEDKKKKMMTSNARVFSGHAQSVKDGSGEKMSCQNVKTLF